MYLKILFATILFISFAPLESDASLIDRLRELLEGDHSTPSPAPPPASSVNPSFSSGVAGDASGETFHSKDQLPSSSPAPQPSPPVHQETCEKMSNQCHDLKNMIACLPQSGIGQKGSFLIVQNDGGNPITVNIVILPLNISYKEAVVEAHEVLKIDMSEIGGNVSIVLNAGNGDCAIHMRSPVSLGFPSYGAYATPTNGVYLLFVTSVIIGGTWTCCCKLRKRRPELDGIAYQQLEMGKTECLSSTIAEGWDQDWDDDWDEEKAVKPSGGHHFGHGLSSRSSDTGERGKNWND